MTNTIENNSYWNNIPFDFEFNRLEDCNENSMPIRERYEGTSSCDNPPKQVLLACGVCGAPATGYNFDQITCESCKIFFRRNALRNMVRDIHETLS